MSSVHLFLNHSIISPAAEAGIRRRRIRFPGRVIASATVDVRPPGLTAAAAVMAAEARVLVGTYARAPAVLVSGKGCKLYDVEGREYLDMTSGIAVNALGHGDPDWVRAVTEQANVLAHVSNVYYSVPQVRFFSK